jgi:predicted alpha-1,2-mannosidase
MRKIVFLPFLFILGCITAQEPVYTSYVDPMIGTGGHGHTFPGATVPFGMVQLSPDTRVDGSWDGCSGYHYSDSVIYGFSHTHLSGTGCSDYGDIMLMPTMGTLSFDKKSYASEFSHRNEKSMPGYYSVKLDKDDIDVELTTTTRVGMHKYTFSKEGKAAIIMDLNHRDKLLQGDVKIIDEKTVEVFRRSEAWARDQYIYARIEFSKKMSDKAGSQNNAWGFTFDVKKGETLLVKVALSTVSTEGAKKNMAAELPGWDFEKVKNDAQVAWNKELGKIEVDTKNAEKAKIFYTALYHTMIQPNVAMDVDGMYRGRDNKIHKAEGFTYYSVFSLWDTFRGAHPLYTIIEKKRTADFINTFLKQYEQGGRLPVWELASNETDCMIGYHSVSVIADAMTKGIQGFSYEEAFEAAKHSAMLDHLGLDAYKAKGFISMEDEHESVSKTLEYAYDDWCIAQMAMVLDKKNDYDYFMRRSQSWKNLFDPQAGFMRPKKNGGWLAPFEPREVNNNFTEGNSWQYSFFVPQDVDGLVKMMGGPEQFEKKLDELFTAPTATTGREQADITGLIGQYAHGNEPSHHMAYLYNYIGKKEKAVKRVQQVLNDFYKASPDGLIGNEDCGQMSAWYVLSSMGFYPVCPGKGEYALGVPAFDVIKIHPGNGEAYTFSSKDGLFKKDFMNYTFTGDGKEIPQPALLPVIPVPVISAASRVFDDSLKVEISGGKEIWYKLAEEKDFHKYAGPFVIRDSKEVQAYSGTTPVISGTVSAAFYKRPNHWKIKINSKYNPQYTAGGDEGLIDGLHGETNWRKGEWQGYQYQDFEAVIDFGEKMKFTEASAGFLQDSRSWILMPSKVEYYASGDGKEYVLIGTETHKIDPMDENVQIRQFTLSSSLVRARYLKVKAYNFGKLPLAHQGAGDGAFIFIDEISVK